MLNPLQTTVVAIAPDRLAFISFVAMEINVSDTNQVGNKAVWCVV